MVLSSNRLSPRFEAVTRDSSMSLFTISRAVKSDEGNYTCHPANLHKASVRLHVVNGESGIVRGASWDSGISLTLISTDR